MPKAFIYDGELYPILVMAVADDGDSDVSEEFVSRYETIMSNFHELQKELALISN